jgi:RNA polymerase sigma factor (sigma-70 family)
MGPKRRGTFAACISPPALSGVARMPWERSRAFRTHLNCDQKSENSNSERLHCPSITAGFVRAEAQSLMRIGGLPDILCHLRQAVAVTGGDPTRRDTDLLGQYVDSSDGLAFEVLVRRHAPLVWSVCRRVLHGGADAEDAFQAVFLTLVRKAHTIDRRASVASWLHKVAYRVALEARRQIARRSAREVPIMEHHLAQPGEDAAWREIRPVLDEEVCRLPEKYRAPVVLCYLQGKSNVEAARELGCPSGTVVTRLAWARRRLRKRLTQRGLSASTGLLAAGLLQRAEAAAVPPWLIDTTLRTSLLMAAGETAAVATHAATAMSLSRAATCAVSVGRVKFAMVAVAACLALVGGTALLRGRGEASEPPVNAAAIATTRPHANALNQEPIENEPNLGPDADLPPKILAYFERIDQDKITVTFRGKGGIVLERVTLPVAADATITRNGQPIRLADLKPGWLLKIMLSTDESKVITIRVKDREFNNVNRPVSASVLRGTLKSLDRGKRITVTVQTGGTDQDHTLPLAKMVDVEINKTPAAVDDLKAGMAVWLKLTPDEGTVVEIIARKTTR